MVLKRYIQKIDALLLGGTLTKKILQKREEKIISDFSKSLNYSFLLQYKKSNQSILNMLCDRYGSDKGEANSSGNPYTWPSHNYADFYELIFGLGRKKVKLVVECGLGTNNPNLASSMGVGGKPGASLKVWRDFFPNAQVIGCDIDKDILFQELRIKTFPCDQTNQSSISTFVSSAELNKNSIDIIIDDGLHEFHAGLSFFIGMIDFLRDDGFFIIEDVNPSDLYRYKKYFEENDSLYEVNFVHLYAPQRDLGGENRLILVRKKI